MVSNPSPTPEILKKILDAFTNQEKLVTAT